MFNNKNKHKEMGPPWHCKLASKFPLLCGNIGYRHHILLLQRVTGMFFLNQFPKCYIKRNFDEWLFLIIVFFFRSMFLTIFGVKMIPLRSLPPLISWCKKLIVGYWLFWSGCFVDYLLKTYSFTTMTIVVDFWKSGLFE